MTNLNHQHSLDNPDFLAEAERRLGRLPWVEAKPKTSGFPLNYCCGIRDLGRFRHDLYENPDDFNLRISWGAPPDGVPKDFQEKVLETGTNQKLHILVRDK